MESSDLFEDKVMASIRSLTESASGLLEPLNKGTPSEMDEDDHFAYMVAASLRKLPPRLKGLARMNIQQILWQMEFSTEPADVHGMTHPTTPSHGMLNMSPTWHPNTPMNPMAFPVSRPPPPADDM